MKKIISIVIFSFFLVETGHSSTTPYIAVGKAKTKRAAVAFPEIQGSNSLEKALGKEIRKALIKDLDFMDLFHLIPETAYLEDQEKSGIEPGKFSYSSWKTIGSELLIKSKVSMVQDRVTLEGYLYSVKDNQMLLGKKYHATKSQAETIAHTFGNEMIERLTGLPGIFLTKIAMTCDRTGKKEIYMMDFDGSNIKQVTHHRSIAFSPTWHPDGTKITYSLFTKRNNIKNINLYEFDLVHHTVRLLSNYRGINSGAAYSPDGENLALTMSFGGNPEIYALDPQSRRLKKLTHSFGFDVDPEYSADGKKLAFVSSRAGKPMLFTMNIDGTDTQRLTYAGRYNAAPSWSPRNDKIAFAGWLDGRFDIFTINTDGTHIDRLTKNQGSNEDPSYSPDGSFIAFTSSRTGKKAIYIMNTDGSRVKRMTYGLGNCADPKWSMPMNKENRNVKIAQSE